MKTNELKTGVRIKLRNGWEATIKDNMRGNTRVCEVYGDFTETGSVYSHDIVAYKDNDGNWHEDIEYTKSQLQCKNAVEVIGF
jgi:hypothetical protein